MNFYIKNNDEKEEGPVDQETLEKWVELDKVFPDTLVRNALLGKWKEARDLNFLEHNLKEQEVRLEEKAGFWEKRKLKKEKERQLSSTGKELSSAYKSEYLPAPATIPQRLAATLFDWIILASIAILFWCVGAIMVHLGSNVQRVFDWLFLIYTIIVLLYYSISFGVFAQTVGMWFWGIFIVKNDISEVYLIRAHLYTIAMFLFGIVSPFVAFVQPNKRALHDLLVGTRIIKIAAKPKT